MGNVLWSQGDSGSGPAPSYLCELGSLLDRPQPLLFVEYRKLYPFEGP